MKEKKNLFLIIIFSVITVVVCAMFGISLSRHKINMVQNNSLVYLEWYYQNDEEKIDISIPAKIETKVNTSQTIYAKMPKDCEGIDTLFFRSIYQGVSVKVDDEIIYSYDTRTIREFGLANPRKLNIVTLPDDIEDKIISITIECPYEKYSGYFSDIEIGNSVDVIKSIYDKYQTGYIFSWVLIVIVICLVIANFILFSFKMNIKNMLYLLLSSLFLGLWLLGDSKLITLNLDSFLVHQITYVSLMLFMILFAIYIRQVSYPQYRVYASVTAFVTVINIVLQIVLYLTKVSDYVIFYPLNLIIILGIFIIYLLNCIEKIKLRKVNHKKIAFRYIIEIILVSAIIVVTIYNMCLSVVSNVSVNSLIGVLFVFLIVTIFAESIVKIVNTALESKVYKERFKEAQNYLIQSQMKPHFIFNTLGAIRTLIMSSPKTAYDMTTNFSKYLRANINNIGPGEKVSFAQELDHIKAYLAIELERFKDRLFVEYDIQCTEFNIPPLSIEPLVENAVKHGVCKRIKGGTVKISSIEYEDRYEVIVEDNGVGFDVNILESEAKANSVGLKYIIIRLKELADADFEIVSKKGKGTKATVTIKKEIIK